MMPGNMVYATWGRAGSTPRHSAYSLASYCRSLLSVLGTEVVYDSPEEYEEQESRAQSLSPATMKQYKDEMEKDMEEMSSGSDQYNLIGKTPEKLDAMIARYHRDMKSSLIENNRRRAMEGM